jgi:plasmid stabilization system protein ParE
VARRLSWSPRARQELREILDYITRNSPGNEASVAKRFFARVASLPDQPGQGRRVPEYEGEDELREVLVHRWRLIYRTTDRTIEIIAVVHGARLLKNTPPL